MRLPRIALILACLLVTFGSASASAGPDTDGDGVPDASDNCLLVPNAPPLDCDTDQDGYGNLCDCNLINDHSFLTCREFWFREHPDFVTGVDSGTGTDMDCNGSVNANDFEDVFLPLWVTGPASGPSGLPCAGTVPCP